MLDALAGLGGGAGVGGGVAAGRVGNRQLAKQWPNEWTQRLMKELGDAERKLATREKLTPKEILRIVRRLLKEEYTIAKPKFVPYRGKR